ncbi:FtsX-like permease family protein [Aeribacillus pallidus]|nr:FtsX-like permease family protein [Aeribacillus pallidus]
MNTNKWFLLNLRLALSSVLLSMLTSFMVQAFQWTLESRQEITFGLTGEITVLTMINGPQEVTKTEASSAQSMLIDYIDKQSLSLVYSSLGDGRPEIIVYDPHGSLPWFPKDSDESTDLTTSHAYLFRGTYTEKQWSNSGTASLLPKEVEISGVIDSPSATDDYQYARTINLDPLPPGNYTINTSDPDQVKHILNLFYQMGFVPQVSKEIPLFTYFINNPFVVITVIFLVMGLLCVVLDWFLYNQERTREFGIRRRYGALPTTLVRENLLFGIAGLLIGSAIGGIMSKLLIAEVSHTDIPLFNLQTFASIAISFIIVILTWSLILYVVIKTNKEVNVDA